MRREHFSSEIDYLAHRRARAKMGWYTHACIYIVVNLGLAALSAHTGRNWAIFPALGWGLGLLIHGAAVWLKTNGRIYERMVAREREALQRNNPSSPSQS